MATFYILPPRPMVAKRFNVFLSAMFPGLHWDKRRWGDLAEAIGVAAASCPDVYVVFREDLPEQEDVEQALRFLFGAEEGDEVIDVRAEDAPDEWTSRRWRLQIPLAG